ncbi:synaptic vesicle transporter [Xylona heveae TC161]|uniref:Synaptic vesicle transporter n=1 Tax=Xylona heveae (strain CBS 132557 / TC161) TaxID=1328760 RepID=A0A165IHQ2_XYLHT|nr:synaptic vesicle transporter [Xylona heveae TC161]KZF24913.1 synaptic vesicle transporter [Xylona heveae TC161]
MESSAGAELKQPTVPKQCAAPPRTGKSLYDTETTTGNVNLGGEKDVTRDADSCGARSASQIPVGFTDKDGENRRDENEYDLEKAEDDESSTSDPEEESRRSTLPRWRKNVILFIVSWMTLAITFSSTSLLAATPEIASEYGTTPEIINITNAGVLLAMGISSLIWNPISDMIGRRHSYNAAIFMFCVCTVGTAVAPNMRTFTALRVVVGLTGTYFMVAGQTILADIFEPTERGTAVGFFMAGSVSGPAIGPCIGGIIVTFASWRIIYWVQTGMAALGLVLSLLLVPHIQSAGKSKDDPNAQEKRTVLKQLARFNPAPVFKQMVYPHVFLADLTCGFLAFYQYALLTSVRSIINPRFHLTSPLVSGLFYLAPGAGFLVGSILGGRFSDRTVKRYIKKRNGVRLPQDRLNSGLLTLFFVLPAASLIYGWTLQKEVGGIALPIICAFFGGAGLMGSFNGLNTYTAEVIPRKRSEVITSKYIVQYIFGAGASAAVVPLIKAVGVGLTFTITVILVLAGGIQVWALARRGLDIERWTENVLGLKLEK